MKLRRVVVTALVMSVAILALAGCNSTSSTSPGMNLTPPAAPSNLVGLFDAEQQSDYLTWTASASAGVVSHEVWRYSENPAAGNTGTLMGTVAVATSYFALPTPSQNGVEHFRLRAVDNVGTRSAFSAAIHLQRHGAPAQGAADPGNDADTGVVRN